jgi:hypothetical protein
VPPLLGRTTTAEDGRPGAAPVVVLGYRFWQRQFGGDAGVLGRHLMLNGVDRTVAGVMPKRFMWRGADVYVPHVFRRGPIEENVRTVHLLGRLKPDVTAAQAEADLRPIIEDLKRREPAQFPIAGAWRWFRSRRRSRAASSATYGSCLARLRCCPHRLRQRLEPAALEGDGPSKEIAVRTAPARAAAASSASC